LAAHRRASASEIRSTAKIPNKSVYTLEPPVHGLDFGALLTYRSLKTRFTRVEFEVSLTIDILASELTLRLGHERVAHRTRYCDRDFESPRRAGYIFGHFRSVIAMYTNITQMRTNNITSSLQDVVLIENSRSRETIKDGLIRLVFDSLTKQVFCA
jgi:hypothetical protein